MWALWKNDNLKNEEEAKEEEEIPPEIDEAELSRKLNKDLLYRVKIADTPCDPDHGWKLEKVVRGINVYISCKPPSESNVPVASASASSASITPSLSSPATAPSIAAECKADSLGATATDNAACATADKSVDTTERAQLGCCKTVGYIEGISAAEAAMFMYDCDRDNLQYFSPSFRIRHEVMKIPMWGISDRCYTYAHRVVRFGRERDRYMAQFVSIRHKKRPEARSRRLNQVVANGNMSAIYETQFLNGKNKDSPDLTRKDVRCSMTYQSEVDPGGIVPLWIVQFLTKREYPKFVEQFTGRCRKFYDNKPLRLRKVPPAVYKRPYTMAAFKAYYRSELKRLAQEDTAEAAAATGKNEQNDKK